ncbi:unnamed protein product [Onchocerca flexuosa]|uniref:RUN domain-containing protein n=1 Tax=Onchocerca flexuosa TaxID=387005 RepID=A0A183H7B1_9BILA|nr:unnamed protein product [Onchocerca flexuosa]
MYCLQAWVRILLNENTIENYLNLLSRNTVVLSKFYEKWAFLRDTERMNILSGYIKGLTRLTVDAPVNSFSLNAWTPTPLILSGLIIGEPARLKQLAKCRCRGGSLSMLEDTELAENALESLCGSTELSISSDAGDSDAAGREIDVTSVYSHPSMLDGENIYLPALDAANSTILSNPVPEESILNYDPHQIRVIRSTHRRVRRSSKSSSVGSSKSSRNESIPTTPNESQNVEEIGEETKNFEESYDNMQQTSSLIYTLNNENKENQDQTIQAYEGKAVKMKENKSFGSDNDLSMNNEFAVHEMPKSSGNWIDSYVISDGVADDINLENSMQNMSHNVLYSLCPAISTDNEQSFTASGSKIGSTSKKSDVELKRSVSMQDDLHMSEHYNEGNSLLGKGWIVHNHCEAEPFVGQASIISSSTNTDSSRNLEMEIRSVLEASNEVVNQKHSENGSLCDEIPVLEKVENLLHRSSDDVKTSFSTSDHQGAIPSKESELEIDSNGSVSQFSDEILINILTSIPHEKGLDSQDFRCFACRKSIGPTFASYRKCSFNEKYYCDGCFNRSDESVIPSRLIRNWDGHPRIVCRSSMTFIESIRDKAVLHLDQINPNLYAHCHALNTVKFLREKLSLSAMYLQSCRKSVAEDLENRVWPKDYLYKDIHLYSFAVCFFSFFFFRSNEEND